jgi:hypothetical protein
VVKARHTVTVNPRLKNLPEMFALQPADMKQLTTTLDVEFTRFEKRQFASEGSAGGELWQRLSPTYKRWKARRYPGRKIMQLTGKGRKTLVNRRNKDHVAKWFLKPRAAVELGTNYKIFAYHTGSTRNPRLPDRDVMQHTDRQASRYTGHVESYFREVKLPRIARVLAAWKTRRSGPRAR